VLEAGQYSVFGAWFNCSKLEHFPTIHFPKCTNFASTWNGCSSLKDFPAIQMPAAVDIYDAWKNCSSMATFGKPTFSASLQNISSAWNGAGSLTTFPAAVFNACSALNNFNFVFMTTSLSAASKNNVLASIIASGATPPAGASEKKIVIRGGDPLDDTGLAHKATLAAAGFDMSDCN
jgi:hypothetical protein